MGSVTKENTMACTTTNGEYEEMEIDGDKHWKYRGKGHWRVYGSKRETHNPAVRCGECLGAGFQIRYGCYECIAVCCVCGYEDVIHDG
jgi:hypothetical protein